MGHEMIIIIHVLDCSSIHKIQWHLLPQHQFFDGRPATEMASRQSFSALPSFSEIWLFSASPWVCRGDLLHQLDVARCVAFVGTNNVARLSNLVCSKSVFRFMKTHQNISSNVEFLLPNGIPRGYRLVLIVYRQGSELNLLLQLSMSNLCRIQTSFAAPVLSAENLYSSTSTSPQASTGQVSE